MKFIGLVLLALSLIACQPAPKKYVQTNYGAIKAVNGAVQNVNKAMDEKNPKAVMMYVDALRMVSDEYLNYLLSNPAPKGLGGLRISAINLSSHYSAVSRSDYRLLLALLTKPNKSKQEIQAIPMIMQKMMADENKYQAELTEELNKWMREYKVQRV
jgi:NADPH-dependent curcumin reductase CurA